MQSTTPANPDEIIYIVIGLCVIVILLLIVSVIQMKRSKLKPGEWLEHPLGIPTGSVRALIAIMIVFITLWVAISDKVSIAEDMPKWLLAIVGAVIGFYFGNRGLSFEKKKETIEEMTIERLNRLREMRDRGEIDPGACEERMSNLMHGYMEFTGYPLKARLEEVSSQEGQEAGKQPVPHD